MNPKFEVGEVAIFFRPDSMDTEVEVTISGPLALRTFVDWHDNQVKTAFTYEITGIPAKNRYGKSWVARPVHLRKKRPPGHETCRWDECVWRPKLEVRA